MKDYYNDLNLADLLSEKHKEIRQVVVNKFSKENIASLSRLEFYLIALLSKKHLSISESARMMNVSRQAAHSCSKNLLKLGYIELDNNVDDKKKKIMSLTKKGILLNEDTLKVKNSIEKEIEATLGKENIKLIKFLLKQQWIK